MAITGGLMMIVAAALLIRDARTQDVLPASVPIQARQAIAKTGATGIEVIATPDKFSKQYVARLQFAAERPGYKACANHYPAYYVRAAQSCPSLVNQDPPAAGWVVCYGEFYSPAQVGCPPVPAAPIVPLTIPRPKCPFGLARCTDQAPGGPVLIRSLQLRAPVAAALAPRAAIAAERPVATVPAPAAPPAAIAQAVRNNRKLKAAGAKALAPNRGAAGASQAVSGAAAAAAAPAGPAVAVALATKVAPRVVVPASETFAATLRASLKTRQWMVAKPKLSCSGENCEWGENGKPIVLPAPRVAPIGHVPCEYEHVSFYVPENRYCPDPAKNAPPPGVASYVSWTDDNSEPPEVFFHRPDYNGRDLTMLMIMGDTDDRFLITDATARERAAAESTVVLVKRDHISRLNDATVRLQKEPSWQPLCSDEQFASLPRPGRCSGVKIGNRLVATSAHCVRNANQCADTSVVLGFPERNGTAASNEVPSNHVYQCTAIVASRQPATIGERGADWTIFRVDRDIDAPSAQLAGSSDVRPSVVTTVIGHPLGLPSIVTRLGVVQVAATNYFIANSDTFVGNSGSAVFSAQSVEDGAPRVLGLLTGGQYDFVDSSENGQQCVKARWCKGGPECLGDDVVYANDMKKALDNLSADSQP
jgi:V8-like Glu-specific endopeptidase